MIILDFTKTIDSDRRSFDRKREKLQKRTKLESVKKNSGVYLIPFENSEPSKNEINLFWEFQMLIENYNVGASYFGVTQFEPHDEIRRLIDRRMHVNEPFIRKLAGIKEK